MADADEWGWVPAPVGMSRDWAALMNAAVGAGEENAPRLQIADAMQEAGEPDWAAFVRRQIADLELNRPGEGGARLCSPVTLAVANGKDVPRVTFDVLQRVRPWGLHDYAWYRSRAGTLAAATVASKAYLNRSSFVFPQVRWYRGFMCSLTHVYPLDAFRAAETGLAAWHLWDDPASPDKAENEWLEELTGFRLLSVGEYHEEGIHFPRITTALNHYVAVAHRADGGRWSVDGGHGLTLSQLPRRGVVPEPIARYLSGRRLLRDLGGIRRVYYHSYMELNKDVSRATKAMMREAGRAARQRVIDREYH